MRRLILVLCLLAAALTLALMLLQRDIHLLESSVDVASALSGDTAGYRNIEGPQPLTFPRDHGPHPDTRIEWWYFTGHLETPEGRPFGFQFTIFRNALAPPTERTAERPSPWATDQLYMGHFALTDIADGRFHAFERFGRGAADLAGATVDPFRVWVGPWSASGPTPSSAPSSQTSQRTSPPATEEPSPSSLWPLRLVASGEGDDGPISLELNATATKPAVLHGEGGYSEKGSMSGSGSMYVSFPRIEVRGLLRLGPQALPVRGSAWMDHEWGTAVLSDMHRGWDWFSIQLDDDREVMLFQLLRRDGSPDPKRSGTLVEADGSSRPLDLEGLEVEITNRWRPNDNAGSYPAGWTLRLPAEGMTLRLQPRVANQEVRVSVRYWEGAVSVEGSDQGQAISGRGYVEMTGYAGGALRRP